MEMYPLIFLIHILIFFPIPTHSLSCVSCQGINCPVVTDCDAGMTLDVCNCCPVCAQGEGDHCGGSFDIHGKCGLGLYCDQQAKQIGICKACTEVIYSGCTVVHGICQCGSSCTHSFDFADKESCLNSVLAQGDTDYCAGKQCPADLMIECPEDSYRPAKKLSVDGCCQLPQPCKCLETGCHNPPSCPAGTMVAELSRGNGEPGNCCSQYTCVNTSLECGVDNSTFTSESDSCIECKCKSGIVTCGYRTCSLPSCEWAALEPGKCCPQCKGCVSPTTRQRYSNGESWSEDNSCIQCQCVNGQSQCTASVCQRRCLNAKKVPGKCCPVCEDKDTYAVYNGTFPDITTPVICPQESDCPTNCRKKLTVEINGCAVCLCEDDILMCPGSTKCSKVCPHGYKKDRQKGCSYCKCQACPTFSCSLTCPQGYAKDFSGCNLCQCQEDSKVTTTPTICFTSAGRTYSSGDSWFDGCHQCYCENGRELCSLINCPLVSCKQPLVKPGDCCPSCPFEAATASTVNISTSCVSTDDQEHLENDVWQLDTCTVCMCLQGDAFCETKRCPPTLCAHPTTRDGECCASCNDEIESQPTTAVGKPCTTLSGVEFDHGSVWKLGDCQSCTCKDGTVTCFSQTCPVLLCKTTVQQKGQCCPKCTAESTYDKICIYEGNWYTHLQTWKDNSLQCTCIHGQSECKTVDCIPCKGDQSNGGDKPHCCLQPTGDNGESFLPTRIGLPMIILFSVLLLAFAVVIALLVVLIVRQRKKHKTKLTAIPKILESRVLQGTQDAATKKRPKSTNLEFLHSTTENRYNTTMSLGDTECCKPLVEKTLSGNEYIQC